MSGHKGAANFKANAREALGNTVLRDALGNIRHGLFDGVVARSHSFIATVYHIGREPLGRERPRASAWRHTQRAGARLVESHWACACTLASNKLSEGRDHTHQDLGEKCP